MAKRPWGTYKPSKDGIDERVALRKLYANSLTVARSLANGCIRRRVEVLEHRMGNTYNDLEYLQLEAQWQAFVDVAIERGLLTPTE